MGAWARQDGVRVLGEVEGYGAMCQAGGCRGYGQAGGHGVIGLAGDHKHRVVGQTRRRRHSSVGVRDWGMGQAEGDGVMGVGDGGGAKVICV